MARLLATIMNPEDKEGLKRRAKILLRPKDFVNTISIVASRILYEKQSPLLFNNV